MTEPYKLPDGWKWVRLGEVLEIIESGSRPKGGVFEIKECIPSKGAEHLNSSGGFNFNNIRFIPKEFFEVMSRGKIQNRDVLVVKDGATTGKVSFVGEDFPYDEAAINEHVFRLRGKEDILSQEFLFWFLYSPWGQSQIQQEFHGSAQGGINQKFADGVLIPLPPFPVQHRLATKLKEIMSEIEKARNACEKQLEAAKALPSAYLREVFESEEAKKWERKRLGEVCEIIMGQSPPGSTYTNKTEGLPFFQGKADFGEYFPTVRIWCTKPIKIVNKEDVLISVRAPVGPVNMSNLKCCIGRGLAGIRCKDNHIINWFVFWYLRFIEKQIASLGSGSTFGAITREDLVHLQTPLPPLETQHRIANYLKEKMAEVEKLPSVIQNQLEAINALPQAYLRKAFRGEL